MAIKVKFVNRDEVMKMLDAIAPNAQAEVGKMQIKVAKDLAVKIKPHAPVGRPEFRRRGRIPGTYRDSINAARLADKKDVKLVGLRSTTDPNATGVFAEWIWHFIEFGTINARRQPHIFPVYRRERKNMKRRLSRALRTAIRKAQAGQKENPVVTGGGE